MLVVVLLVALVVVEAVVVAVVSGCSARWLPVDSSLFALLSLKLPSEVTLGFHLLLFLFPPFETTRFMKARNPEASSSSIILRAQGRLVDTSTDWLID